MANTIAGTQYACYNPRITRMGIVVPFYDEVNMGKPAARLSDTAFIGGDAHGCLCCAHPCTGPVVQASPNVFINGLPVARKGDPGVHSGCCGANTFVCKGCSSTVKVNGKGVARLGDATTHCGGSGKLTKGSPNVFVGG